MEYNKSLDIITPSASMVRGLDGRPVFANLAVGSPDIEPPVQIRELTYAFYERPVYSYLPSKGTPKALQNIKELVLGDDPSIDIDQNLVLCSGAKQGIYLSLKTITNPGDTVVLLQPYWLSYPPICYSLGLKVIGFEFDTSRHTYDLDILKKELLRQQAKVIVVNNPNNPLGLILPAEWLYDLASFCSIHNIWMVLDEVYKDLAFVRRESMHKGITALANVIRVGSLSKSIAIPGFRIGYVAGNPEFIAKYNLFNQHINTCINGYTSFITERIEKKVYDEFAEKCATVYRERFDVSLRILSERGISLMPCEASFYAMAKLPGRYNCTAEWIDDLAGKGIAVTEGEHYGPQFSDYIRVCMTLPKEKLAGVLAMF